MVRWPLPSLFLPESTPFARALPGWASGSLTYLPGQVEEHIRRIREELDREREERNYFQLERDKIHTFWEITRRQLEEKKAELRNKDREMEEAEERHQVEIKVSEAGLPVYVRLSTGVRWSGVIFCPCSGGFYGFLCWNVGD